MSDKDMIGQLCDFVRDAGLTMTLHGKPVSEAELRTGALASAVERIAALDPVGGNRPGSSDGSVVTPEFVAAFNALTPAEALKLTGNAPPPVTHEKARCPHCDYPVATQTLFDAHWDFCGCDDCKRVCWRAWSGVCNHHRPRVNWRARAEATERRLTEVEARNAKLEAAVTALREALAGCSQRAHVAQYVLDKGRYSDDTERCAAAYAPVLAIIAFTEDGARALRALDGGG